MRKIYNDPQLTQDIYNKDDNRATKEDINILSNRIDDTVQALTNLADALSAYEQQMAESVNTEQLTTVNAAIQTLQATSANLGTVQIQNLDTTVKATIALLEAVSAKVSSLEAQTAEITALIADSANLDEATINTLTATTANIANWILENISAQTIVTNSATFQNATVGALEADTATISNDATIGGNLDVTGDITGHDAEFSEIKSVEDYVENITWAGKTTIADADHFIVAVPHFENGQYYFQLRNDDTKFATVEIFNSVDNYFVRWSQNIVGNITNIYKDGQNDNAVLYIEIENPDGIALDLYYASTSATPNLPAPATYSELPVEPAIDYPVTYKDGSKFFKNVDLAQQGSTVGTLRQILSTDIDDATDNVSYDTTDDATIVVYTPDQELNTDDDVEFNKVTTTFLGVRDFSTRNFTATELQTLNTIDLTKFDDGSIIVVRIGQTTETNAPSGAYIKETINGQEVLFDIVKTRNMPVVLTGKPLVWDPITESIVESDDLNITGDLTVSGDTNVQDLYVNGSVKTDLTVEGDITATENITAHDIIANNDLFINNNAVISGDLEVRGTTFSSEVENVQADGDWIVLRANNQSPLANGDYAGFVFHNYNSAGKDAAITVDNTGTFRVSTQTTEAVSPLSNTWLVDEQYFHSNVNFSQATLLTENYPVTRYQEVFTDIEAYKDANDNHYFYDPNAATIEYYDNVVFNTVLQRVELAGNVVSFTPDPTQDTPHEVHFYTSISFMEPQASDMEAIATRDETSNWSQNEIAMYDKSTEKFVGVGMPANNNDILSATIDNTDPQNPVTTYDWKSPASSLFDIIYPVGVTYNQYPGQASPNTLWGTLSTWTELNFGGAFFRANGGNASTFENTKTVSSVSGTSITFTAAHGLAAGNILRDPVNNVARLVSSVTNTTTVVVNSAFPTRPTTLYASQTSQNKSHSHTTNSQSTSSARTSTKIYNSSNTEITNTGAMSAHSSVNFTIVSNSQSERGTPISFNSSSMSSLIYHKDQQVKTYFYASDGTLRKSDTLYSLNIDNATVVGGAYYGYYSGTLDFAHTHNMQHNHTVDISHTHGTNSNGGADMRPENFTYKVWVRTA